MIIGNGKLITNDTENPFFENGAVRIVDQLVDAVGDFEELKRKYPEDDVLDVKGRVIMPGLINAHTHIYSSYARGMSVSKPTTNFLEILENQWWSLDRKLTLEDCKLNAHTLFIEGVRLGVTTVFDHHASPNAAEGSLFAIAEAANEIGVRGTYSLELTDREGVEFADKEIKENVDFIKAYNTDEQDMIKGLFGMHASFTISDDTLYKVKEAMAGIDAGYHIHVGEGIEDQLDALRKYGRRVTERLFNWDLLGPKTLAIHAVHTNHLELDIIKDTDTSVVHNPMSNMGNAIGTTPVVKMLEKGMRVGLGTDAYTHDMVESAKVAKILQSHHLSDPTVGFGQALELLFHGNPEISKHYFKHDIGVLKPNAYADVITLDYKTHTPMNGDNWGGHFLFGMYGRMTNDVIINGKMVMRDRELLTVDEDAIYARHTERAREIWKDM